RVGLQHSRARAPHRGRRAGARLSDGAGGDPRVLGGLRAHQPARRSVVHVPRPADPLLMRRGNRSTVLGGTIFAVIVAIGLLAPRGAEGRGRAPRGFAVLGGGRAGAAPVRVGGARARGRREPGRAAGRAGGPVAGAGGARGAVGRGGGGARRPGGGAARPSRA